jgi:hypothetical protein
MNSEIKEEIARKMPCNCLRRTFSLFNFLMFSNPGLAIILSISFKRVELLEEAIQH